MSINIDMGRKIKIKNNEILGTLNVKEYVFPKYVRQLLNLANANAQGTRPKIVGQMTELMQEFGGNCYRDWEKWYLKKKPDGIKNATERTFKMIKNLQSTIVKIDEKMIEEWVKELVVTKTFTGLKFQEAILAKIASLKKVKYRLAKPKEEAKGIDGYIANIAVSIKADTYKEMKHLQENIEVNIIKYEKKKDGILFEHHIDV